MYDVVCINGSPRTNGNTDNYLNLFCNVLQNEFISVKTINLRDKKINICYGCGKCENSTNHKCFQDDDMGEIIEDVLEAKCIVLASPTYYANVTAQLKAFMDRTDCLFHKKKLQGKLGIGITVGGFQNGGQELTLQSINAYFMIHNMIVIGGNGGSTFFGISGKGYSKKDYQNDALGMKSCVKTALMLSQMLDNGRPWYEYDTKGEALNKVKSIMNKKYPLNNYDNIKWNYNISYDDNIHEMSKIVGDNNLFDEFYQNFNEIITEESNNKYGSINYMKLYQKEREKVIGDWDIYFSKFLDNIYGKIVVIGINDGQEIAGVVKKKNIETFGIDLCERAIKRGKFMYPDINFDVGRCEELPYPDECFDCYISLRTLQVTGIDFNKSFLEAKGVLKNNGKIIVSLPSGIMNNDEQIISGQIIETTYYGYKIQVKKFINKMNELFKDINIIENAIETFITAIK